MHTRNALKIALLAGTCAAVSSLSALAQTAETGLGPDFASNTTDGNSFLESLLYGAPRTYQMILDQSVLDQIPVGSVITSIAFRLEVTATQNWPAAATTFSDYEIRLGKAASLAAVMSNTFADNVVPGTDVLVRDGLLAPLPGTFSASATAPNAESWGPALTFTKGFYYTGGGLALTVRHSGLTSGADENVDAVTGTGVRSVFADGKTAAIGSLIPSGVVLRIGFVRDVARLNNGVNKLFVGEEFATADGKGGTLVTMLSNQPRSIGTIVAPSELDAFAPGTELTGISIRNDQTPDVPVGAAWPQAIRIFPSWSLQLSKSVFPVGAMSQTIANNAGGDAVTVYNAPLAISSGSLLPDPTLSSFVTGSPYSFVVPFQSRYMYRGGSLFMLNRTNGHGQADNLRSDSEPTPFVQERWSGDASAVTLPYSTSPPAYRFNADAGVIVPNERALQEGNGSTWQILSPNDATYQVIIDESELKHIPIGSVIDSFALRRTGGLGSAWPATDVATLQYDVWLSTAARTPGTMSTTFATNEGADKFQVRKGALGVKALSYPSSGGGAQPFGPAIEFQRGFVYHGGSLCLTVRTTGLPGVAIPSFTGDFGSSKILSVTTADSSAAVGGFVAGPVIKFGYVASGMTVGAEATGRRIFDSNRTNQMFYSASALNDIPPGSKITGMSFRNRVTQTGGSYPASDIALSRFDVALSTPTNSSGTMSATVSENEGADRIDARTGPLTLPAGTFKDSPILPTNDPDEFDFYIDFPQAFFYRGGGLCVTIRSESPVNALGGFDVAAMSSSALATMRKDDSNADAAVLGPYAAPPIIRFAYTPPSSCLADLNKDGFVDDQDFQIFVFAYNTLDCGASEMPTGCPADLNFDGVVDDLDFQIFVVAYNELVCP